jgi:hypothetical protein
MGVSVRWRTMEIAMGERSDREPDTISKWAVLKDRLGIAAVIVSLLILLFFMFDGSIMNFQCSFTEFVSLKCNRYDARPRPWGEIKHRD